MGKSYWLPFVHRLSACRGPAIAKLAQDLRRRNSAYAHGVFLPSLAAAIADKILDRFGQAAAPPADAAAWTAIEAAVQAWFAELTVPRRHYVPCTIVADRAAPFELGAASASGRLDL